jgi:hypothetical protein
MIAKLICRISGILALSLAVATMASAQYGGSPGMGGGGGTTTPGNSNSYGSNTGRNVGIAVGVPAAAVGTVLLIRHHHHKAQSSTVSLVGCTRTLMNGLSLTDENDNLTYTLLSSKGDLRPGEKVELKGVVAKDQSGSRTFRVREAVTDYGTCGSTSAANVN